MGPLPHCHPPHLRLLDISARDRTQNAGARKGNGPPVDRSVNPRSRAEGTFSDPGDPRRGYFLRSRAAIPIPRREYFPDPGERSRAKGILAEGTWQATFPGPLPRTIA